MSTKINKRQYIEDTFKIKIARHLNIDELYREFLSVPTISIELADRSGFTSFLDPALPNDTSLSLLLRQYLFYLHCRDWNVNSSGQDEHYHAMIGDIFFSNLWYHRVNFNDQIVNQIAELIKTFHVEYLQNHRWVVRPEFAFLTLWVGSANWAQSIRHLLHFAKFGLDDLEQIVRLKSPELAFNALVDCRSYESQNTIPELSWERLLIDHAENYEPYYAATANECGRFNEPDADVKFRIYKSLYVLIFGCDLGFDEFLNEK